MSEYVVKYFEATVSDLPEKDAILVPGRSQVSNAIPQDAHTGEVGHAIRRKSAACSG